ncbi:MAG: hypothetical protein LQ341_001744 [Variospora aurantia]|nr:MAG: hypothetical protein LQ341_001744 [Variospora aurantia]
MFSASGLLDSPPLQTPNPSSVMVTVTTAADQPLTLNELYARQVEHLSLLPQDKNNPEAVSTAAVQANFITPRDPVIQTANGGRLPTVPLAEAKELNRLKDAVENQGSQSRRYERSTAEQEIDHGATMVDHASGQSSTADAPLRSAIPLTKTHPLFPQLPLYGPPTLLRNLQTTAFQLSSAILSTAFLGTIVLGSLFTSIPLLFHHLYRRLTFRNPDARRPFYDEEKRRQKIRKQSARAWKRRRNTSFPKPGDGDDEELSRQEEEYEPTEGGKDPLICDLGYYARRVGLDVEEFSVQTEDGFILALWHIYNPKEYTRTSSSHRDRDEPMIFPNNYLDNEHVSPSQQHPPGKRRYPVLLIHGLLQSVGSYCTNDDDSLAFYLAKSGYDVWLGNNRHGMQPRHQMLSYSDPRMWNWNIRQMGVMDLPALISRVLSETDFPKLALVCHSQGTTETFVALAKEQRPEIGNKISVFCALAPAVYAGSLIGKMYFKFMRIISPGMFRVIFGIHAFIPLMMTMHRWLPGSLYGALGYRVFSFLFNWSDTRWDRGLRDRLFQFAPVYVSAESMRWWLGRECFASQKCILATREEAQQEEAEDEGNDEGSDDDDDNDNEAMENYFVRGKTHQTELGAEGSSKFRGRNAWYSEQVPPFALWVAGSDKLVDGRRLLRRFERGREPCVRVVHAKIIEEYEHLDIIWAMDMIEKVGKEVKEVIWKTASGEAREVCRVPKDCGGLGIWDDPARR